MLRWLLCLPAAAIAITAVAGELVRPAAAPSARLAAVAAPDLSPEPDAPAPSGSIRRSPDGLYRIDAMVNGTRVNFIVDTGSSVVVLTEGDARRTGLATGGAPRIDVQTANGNAAMRMTRIDDLRIGKRSVGSVQAAIVEQGLTTSLLGQNALARLDALSIRDGVLTFGSSD